MNRLLVMSIFQTLILLAYVSSFIIIVSIDWRIYLGILTFFIAHYFEGELNLLKNRDEK